MVIYGHTDTNTEVLPASLGPRLGIDHFGFREDNRAAIIGELRRKGVPILEEPITVRPGVQMA